MVAPRILDEAADELVAAADYLDEERPGHAQLFLAEYALKLKQIARFPRSGAPMRWRVTGFELRAFSIRRFRYVVIVALDTNGPTIVAVAHTSREPGYWRERVTSDD